MSTQHPVGLVENVRVDADGEVRFEGQFGSMSHLETFQMNEMAEPTACATMLVLSSCTRRGYLRTDTGAVSLHRRWSNEGADLNLFESAVEPDDMAWTAPADLTEINRAWKAKMDLRSGESVSAPPPSETSEPHDSFPTAELQQSASPGIAFRVVLPSSDGRSIGQAQDELRHALDSGVHCRCCGQYARLWKKTIISNAAASLCKLVRLYAGTPLHLDVLSVSPTNRGNGNFSQLALWGLIEPGLVAFDQRKRTSGYWQPTEKGIRFARGLESVKKHVITYNDVVICYEGESITISDALGNRFDYRALMSERPDQSASGTAEPLADPTA